MSKLPGLSPRMPNIARTGSRMPSMQKVVQSTRSSLSSRTTSSRSTLTTFSPGPTRCEPFIGGRRNSLIQQKSPRHSGLLFLSAHSLNHLRENQSGSEKQGWDENGDWSTAIVIAVTILHHTRKVARFLLWMRGEMDFHLPHRWPPWLTRKPHEPWGSLQDLIGHIHDPVSHSFRFKLFLSILSRNQAYQSQQPTNMNKGALCSSIYINNYEKDTRSSLQKLLSFRYQKNKPNGQ